MAVIIYRLRGLPMIQREDKSGHSLCGSRSRCCSGARRVEHRVTFAQWHSMKGRLKLTESTMIFDYISALRMT